MHSWSYEMTNDATTEGVENSVNQKSFEQKSIFLKTILLC